MRSGRPWPLALEPPVRPWTRPQFRGRDSVVLDRNRFSNRHGLYRPCDGSVCNVFMPQGADASFGTVLEDGRIPMADILPGGVAPGSSSQATDIRQSRLREDANPRRFTGPASVLLPLIPHPGPRSMVPRGLPEGILIREKADGSEVRSDPVEQGWGVDQHGPVDNQLAGPPDHEGRWRPRRRRGAVGDRHPPADRPAAAGTGRGDAP